MVDYALKTPHTLFSLKDNEDNNISDMPLDFNLFNIHAYLKKDYYNSKFVDLPVLDDIDFDPNANVNENDKNQIFFDFSSIINKIISQEIQRITPYLFKSFIQKLSKTNYGGSAEIQTIFEPFPLLLGNRGYLFNSSLFLIFSSNYKKSNNSFIENYIFKNFLFNSFKINTHLYDFFNILKKLSMNLKNIYSYEFGTLIPKIYDKIEYKRYFTHDTIKNTCWFWPGI